MTSAKIDIKKCESPRNGSQFPAPNASTNATPLHYAAFYGHLETVKLLLSRGADPNAKNSYNVTPLMNAAGEGYAQIVDALLKAGATTGIQIANGYGVTDPGFTALMFAARGGHAGIVRALLASGAETDVRAADGMTAGRIAEAAGQTSVLRLLQAGGEPPMTSVPQAQASTGIGQEEMQRMMDAAAKKAFENQHQSVQFIVKSDIDQPVARLPQHLGDFALIVGIDKYSEELPQAQFAERDAQAVRSHVVALGYPERNIKTLIGTRASKANFEAYLEDWLPRNVKEDSQVFFYFSGHGAPDASTKQAYLVPWDGTPNFLKKTGYPLKKLYAQLNALKAKQVIVALDSCFSGSGGRSVLAEGARPLVTQVDTSISPAGKVTVFAAASPTEITATLKEEGHGIFTYYFLKGLGGEAKDASGTVTAKGLYEYLKPKVQDAASRQNRDQTQSCPVKMPKRAAAQGRVCEPSDVR